MALAKHVNHYGPPSVFEPYFNPTASYPPPDEALSSPVGLSHGHFHQYPEFGTTCSERILNV